MHVLRVRNVHEALPKALALLNWRGVRQPSRNGEVIRLSEPVATVYARPTERVECHAWRDSNPFFHFYESLWMLAGRRDIAPLTRYVARMASFSDDGVTQNAAYGFRWRCARLAHRPIEADAYHPDVEPAGRDQLSVIVDALRSDPGSRQQVLQIWDHALDLGTTTRDHACNLTATFQIQDGKLDMVVFNRSNDVIWGCYGSNAVHFSMLLEYVARRVGAEVGTYTQVSVNWHAYVEQYEKMVRPALDHAAPFGAGRGYVPSNPYPGLQSHPLGDSSTDWAAWDVDCRRFVTDTGRLPDDNRATFEPFFGAVAWPIVAAHDSYKDAYKDGGIDEALRTLEECAATDWRHACTQWLLRRQERRASRDKEQK